MATAEATIDANVKPGRKAGGERSRFGVARLMNFAALWRLGTFLLALVSFGALLSTGELAAPYVVTFLTLWAVALAVPTPPSFWKNWMGTLLTAGILLVFVLQLISGRTFHNIFYLFMALAQDFNNIMKLLLFLMIYKLFTLGASRDYLHVQIVAFFTVLATAMVTVSFTFSFFFLAYIVLATVTLVMYSIASRGEKVIKPSGGDAVAAVAVPLRRFPLGRLLSGGALLSVAVFALVIVLFLLVPHYSLQKLDAPLRRSTPEPEGPAVTGFSEEVRLGSFKGIEPDPTVVMRVETEWVDPAMNEEQTGGPPVSHLRIRGVAMDRYEGNRWRRAERRQLNDSTLVTTVLRPEIASRLDGPQLRQKIYQNPNASLRIFAVSFPMKIDFAQAVELRVDPAMSTYQVRSAAAGQGITDPFSYEVKSELVGDGTEALRRFVQQRREGQAPELSYHLRLPRWQRVRYLQLPDTPVIAEVRAMAGQTMNAETEIERAVQASDYLRNFYEYSLDPPPMEEGEDPLRAFLFRHRQGHCEYFATALVLMLRSQGIPARMVNGFYSTEWNDLAGLYVVKQSDAHSWAEVWLNGVGWVTMDATPPDLAGSGAYEQVPQAATQYLWEYLRIQWQRWVIDFSPAKQSAIYRNLRENSGIAAVLETADRLLGRLPGDGSGSTPGTFSVTEEPEAAPRAPLLVLAPVLVAAALVVVALLVWQRWRLGRRAVSDVDYLAALLKKLEKAGYARRTGQTPGELLEALPAEAAVQGAAPEDLRWLLGLYYREKFSGEAAGAEDRRRALRIVEQLELERTGAGSV